MSDVLYMAGALKNWVNLRLPENPLVQQISRLLRPTRNWRQTFCLVALGLYLAAPVDARMSGQLQPVDQAVGDLDLLSTSMRRVEVGLRVGGEQTGLFRPPVTNTLSGASRPPYYRVGSGYVARVERMDYLVSRPRGHWGLNQAAVNDGRFMEVIPANTVFELRPINRKLPTVGMAGLPERKAASLTPFAHYQTKNGQVVVASQGPQRMEHHLNLLIDPRIDLRTDSRRNSRVNAAPHLPIYRQDRTLTPTRAGSSMRLYERWSSPRSAGLKPSKTDHSRGPDPTTPKVVAPARK